MFWRIEVKNKHGIFDAEAASVKKAVEDLGINSVQKIDIVHVYNIEADFRHAEIKRVCTELLIDKIIHTYSCHCLSSREDFLSKKVFTSISGEYVEVEIAYNPGVMDPVEYSVIKGIRDLGLSPVKGVSTAKKYLIYGNVSKKDVNVIINKLLCNRLIQHVVTSYSSHIFSVYDSNATTKDIEITLAAKDNIDVLKIDLLHASKKKLLQISRDGQLFLNIDEMSAIQRYFRKLGRNPTDCEVETIAQTWSEHCCHKTFRGNILYQYTEKGKKRNRLIRNLLKSTIVRATKEINKSWCVSVFEDNAGIIKFDKDWNICFKVETHNHPSALEPFGGANTGIGGVIRDILGTGLGGKPICNTDVFCFAPPDLGFDDLPAGVLHPKRIMKGVVSGVRDYGNKMGIPTVNGAILFDKGFLANPLVYCGTVGLIPKNKVKKSPRKGDLIVVIGGRTGRDGIHGATFSSGELTTESEEISSGAVQIGDPIQEKKVLDALIKARDMGLYTAITDCGAGGLSSAVGEMGKELGARVYLERVPLKYNGLKYTEIWISESQERMVVSVRRKDKDKLIEVFSSENVEATVIGEFTGTGRLELFYKGIQVCDIDMDFLHNGIADVTKKAVWNPPKKICKRVSYSSDLTDKLKEVLSHYNVCSKEWVIRQYDHEVQGGSIIKPLTGSDCDGPSDASVITPLLGSVKGIAVSNGINIRYGKLDPYWMAASCIDEAIRQIICVGGDVDKIAILDNFCWGNPDKPDRLGSLVRAAEGCYKTAVGYGVPFISGKDSLNNEYTDYFSCSNDGKTTKNVKHKTIAIPATLLISAVGIIEDVRRSVTMDFKRRGNLIYCVGRTYDEIGGSIYMDTFGMLGDNVPKLDTKYGLKVFRALTKVVKKGLVQSMHDCSEGGLAVALAEMCFSGRLGATVHLDKVPFYGEDRRNDIILFSESNSRFLVEVSLEHRKAFEHILKDIDFEVIGLVDERRELLVYGVDGQLCIHADIVELKESWKMPLAW